jgi:hypothetical protein
MATILLLGVGGFAATRQVCACAMLLLLIIVK